MTDSSEYLGGRSGLATEFRPAVYTRTAGDSSLASSGLVSRKNQERWERVINDKLIEWGRNAEQGVQNDEFPPPTKASIQAAIQFGVKQWIKSNFEVASGVTPNGDGGVSFEWEDGEVLYKVEFLHDGSIQQTFFQGARLIWHDGF